MNESLDLREKGGARGGERQASDRRLFVQLLAFGDSTDSSVLVRALEESGLEGVLYEDANDPTGVGLMTWAADPAFFVTRLRRFLQRSPFAELTQKPEFTMLGRTYSIGYEPQLEDWLLDRPRRVATGTGARWAIYYPLRRTGAFSQLTDDEQMAVLREHGTIGHRFGEAGYAQDLRLACFGLDQNDNDFIIGLVGKELFPLSACIQAMRRTKQTAGYVDRMGPFFVGRALWQKMTAEKL